MKNGIILEICCGSAEDAIEAARGGADRVELNNNLFQGGLTPSIGTLEIAKEHIGIPVMTMVRPRAGGFCYTETELAVARADAKALLRHGADGLVFGFLNADGTVDVNQTRAFVGLAEGKPCVFHRTLTDTSVANNRGIYYGGCLYPPEDRIEITDRDYVAAVRHTIRQAER